MLNKIDEMIEQVKGSLLTKDNQKATNKYIDKLKEVLEFKRQAEAKKEESSKAIAVIESEIEALNTKHIIETDPKELEKISELRKSLRLELEDHKGMVDTKYMYILKGKLDDLQEFEAEANKEKMQFNNEIKQKVIECRELIQKIDNQIYSINAINNQHAYKKVDILLNKIKARPKVDHVQNSGSSGWK